MPGKERDAIHGGEATPETAVEHETVHADPAFREDGANESSSLEGQAEQAEKSATTGTADTPEDENDGVDQGAAANPDELRLEIQRLSHEREQLVAQYTRLRADFENFRRRKEEEFAQLKESAMADVVKQILPVLDNLERAAAATVSESDNAAEGQLLQGINLVLRQFKKVLEQIGVEAIPSVGHPFNPDVHEAVMQVEAGDTYEPGTVVEELQRGYRMGDRVLRYSMVNVAASE